MSVNPRSRSGFSLVEYLAAAAVSGIVLVGAAEVMRNMKAEERANAASDESILGGIDDIELLRKDLRTALRVGRVQGLEGTSLLIEGVNVGPDNVLKNHYIQYTLNPVTCPATITNGPCVTIERSIRPYTAPLNVPNASPWIAGGTRLIAPESAFGAKTRVHVMSGLWTFDWCLDDASPDDLCPAVPRPSPGDPVAGAKRFVAEMNLLTILRSDKDAPVVLSQKVPIIEDIENQLTDPDAYQSSLILQDVVMAATVQKVMSIRAAYMSMVLMFSQ